ncbi:hypothetical protein [Streptomyces rimosus]|uniref:hypothetical protein n=1 Tax=Streptomyces rimosus TaxID=1927 RepID=UPI0004C637EC|nr:hypothetical protein [Streptomyces rimosus]
MISKRSGGYWSVGITVTWSPQARTTNGQAFPGWKASLEFFDDGHADDDVAEGQVSTQGHLETRYFVTDVNIPSTPYRPGTTVNGLTAAIDVLLTDAERLGIDLMTWSDDRPFLYYRGDGEDPNHAPPQGWRETLNAEAARMGWRSYATTVDA